jgi:excinuclease UvrABC ATPase subunit
MATQTIDKLVESGQVSTVDKSGKVNNPPKQEVKAVAPKLKSQSELMQERIEALEAELNRAKANVKIAASQDQFVEWLNTQDLKFDNGFKIRLEYKPVNDVHWIIDYQTPTGKVTSIDGKGRIVYDWSVPTINGNKFPLKGEKSLDVDKFLEDYPSVPADKFRATTGSMPRMEIIKAIPEYQIVNG